MFLNVYSVNVLLFIQAYLYFIIQMFLEDNILLNAFVQYSLKFNVGRYTQITHTKYKSIRRKHITDCPLIAAKRGLYSGL